MSLDTTSERDSTSYANLTALKLVSCHSVVFIKALHFLPVTIMLYLCIGNETCVVGKCYFCKTHTSLCPASGKVEVSMVYWVGRKLKLHTSPPKYMPFSTPRMEMWVLLHSTSLFSYPK